LRNSILLDIRHKYKVSQADVEVTALEKVGNKKRQVVSEFPSVERAKETKAPRGVKRLLKVKEDGYTRGMDQVV
jgi:hypothetical protein